MNALRKSYNTTMLVHFCWVSRFAFNPTYDMLWEWQEETEF